MSSATTGSFRWWGVHNMGVSKSKSHRRIQPYPAYMDDPVGTDDYVEPLRPRASGDRDKPSMRARVQAELQSRRDQYAARGEDAQDAPIWERLELESDLTFERFRVWRETPPPVRDLTLLLEPLNIKPSPTTGRAPQWLHVLASELAWTERARSYDAYKERLRNRNFQADAADWTARKVRELEERNTRARKMQALIDKRMEAILQNPEALDKATFEQLLTWSERLARYSDATNPVDAREATGYTPVRVVQGQARTLSPTPQPQLGPGGSAGVGAGGGAGTYGMVDPSELATDVIEAMLARGAHAEREGASQGDYREIE